MGALRTILGQRFSEKVYPNLNSPDIKRAVEGGRKSFQENYLNWVYGGVIDGCVFQVDGGLFYSTHNPADGTIVGTFPILSKDKIAHVSKLLSAVRRRGIEFSQTVPWQKRVELLLEISKVVEERFWLLVAAKQHETGQSLMEAIGETDEEVDFPLASAMYLQEIHEDTLLPTPRFSGDYNGKRYVPHGVFLNVCPFNFPGAIPMDMACKALAMGNAFIEKSSDKSSLCGYLVYESIVMAFKRLGIPHEGVVNYAPGGPEVVDMFLASPDIAGVSFTGSSAALTEIKAKHGTMLRRGYHGRAPLVFGSAETSGVNIVVVWHDADVARAALECVKAFTGRGGQKCSSARVIMVHKEVKALFDNHLLCELNRIRFGDVLEGADTGPVITEDAGRVIRQKIDKLFCHSIAATSQALHVGCAGKELSKINSFPRFLDISGEVLKDINLAREFMNTEIFGPVTSVIAVPDIDAVKGLCELSDYALTGACFTADIEVQLALSNVIPAGNLYHNRKCTGALVETECFGGLRSLSSPSGIKGKQALALFGSQQTVSGFYDPSWGAEEREEFVRRMQSELGVVFSKA